MLHTYYYQPAVQLPGLNIYNVLARLFATIVGGKNRGPHETLGGQNVKSKGEKVIADFLFQNNIRYKYEKPARIRTWFFFSKKIGTPDFYLPDYDVYVEYWGMINAEDRDTRHRYRHRMWRKISRYREHQIRFISLYPNNIHNARFGSVIKRKFLAATGTDFPEILSN
jgi:DNA helicase-4